MEESKTVDAGVIEKIDNAFVNLDAQRTLGLERMRTLAGVRQKALVRERARLERKHGASHPRVARLDAKLFHTDGLTQELEREIAKLKIEAPDVDRGAWTVHGLVHDSEGTALAGYTVSLYDEEDRWLEAAGHACTDEHGHFVLRYSPGEEPVAEEGQPFRLTVTDAGQVRHREDVPVYLAVGRVDFRGMVLAEPAAPCPPPEEPSGGESPTGKVRAKAKRSRK